MQQQCGREVDGGREGRAAEGTVCEPTRADGGLVVVEGVLMGGRGAAVGLGTLAADAVRCVAQRRDTPVMHASRPLPGAHEAHLGWAPRREETTTVGHSMALYLFRLRLRHLVRYCSVHGMATGLQACKQPPTRVEACRASPSWGAPELDESVRGLEAHLCVRHRR